MSHEVGFVGPPHVSSKRVETVPHPLQLSRQLSSEIVSFFGIQAIVQFLENRNDYAVSPVFISTRQKPYLMSEFLVLHKRPSLRLAARTIVGCTCTQASCHLLV